MTAASREPHRPTVRIRNVEQADLASVLALNEQSVPAVNSLRAEQMEWFVGESASFRVAVLSSSIAGFLICLPPEAPVRQPELPLAEPAVRGFPLYRPDCGFVGIPTSRRRQRPVQGCCRESSPAIPHARLRSELAAAESRVPGFSRPPWLRAGWHAGSRMCRSPVHGATPSALG